MTKALSWIRKSVMMLMWAGLTGCSLMTEDLKPCPQGLDVRFVYNYNMQRADMFCDHVGSVTLYVLDENGRLVHEQSVSNDELRLPLGDPNYRMHVEGLPEGRYHLRAVANQRDSRTLKSMPGVRYQWTRPQLGEDVPMHTVTLTRTAESRAPYDPVNDLSQALDTLWIGSGKRNDLGQEAEVIADQVTTATVSLVRDTKHLNISLRELDSPEEVDADDYEVMIIDDNTVLDLDNNVVENLDTVVYHPYHQRTETMDMGAGNGVERSAHYDVMFNRLRYNTDNPDANALLYIRKRSTGETVALINLPYMLAQGRMAYEYYNYSPQEYLDREYDYRLELFLRGDRWQYLTICIDLLSWAKRIQRVNF